MLLIALLALPPVACTTETHNTSGEVDTIQTDDAQMTDSGPSPKTEVGVKLVHDARHAASVAVAKAEELGYQLENMLLEIDKTSEGGWRVALRPNSKVQSGGDLTVEVNADGEITDVKRWR